MSRLYLTLALVAAVLGGCQATLDAAFAGPACFNLSYDDLRLPVASGANYVAGLRPVALGGATYFGFAASTLDVPGNATFVYTSGTPVGLVADAGLFDATSVTLVQTATPNVLLVRGKVSGRGDYVQCANRTLAGAEGVVITVPLVGCTGLSSLVITQPPTFQPAPSVRVLGLALCPAAGSSLAPLAPGTLLPDPESAFTLPDAHPAHGRRLEGLDDLVAEVRAAKAKAEAALDDVKAKEEVVKAEIKAKHAAALEGLKNKTEEAVAGAKRKAGGAGRDAARALDDVSLEAKAKLGSVKVLETFDEFSFNPTVFGAQYTPDYVDLRAAGLAFLNVGLLNVQSPRVAPTPPNVGIGAYDDPLGAVAEAGVVLPSSVVVQGLCNVGGALGLACPPAWGTLSAFVRTPGTKGRLVQCASVSLGKLGGDLNQTTYLATEAAEFILKPCAAYGPADLFYLARTSALPGLPGDNTILLLTIDNLAVRGVRGGSVWEARAAMEPPPSTNITLGSFPPTVLTSPLPGESYVG